MLCPFFFIFNRWMFKNVVWDQVRSVHAPRRLYCFSVCGGRKKEPFLCSCFITHNRLQMAGKKRDAVSCQDNCERYSDTTLHSCVHSFFWNGVWWYVMVSFSQTPELLRWSDFSCKRWSRWSYVFLLFIPPAFNNKGFGGKVPQDFVDWLRSVDGWAHPG